jgi:hypothetical protein
LILIAYRLLKWGHCSKRFHKLGYLLKGMWLGRLLSSMSIVLPSASLRPNGPGDLKAWVNLARTVSVPFPKPRSGKICVKVVNHFGDEVQTVFRV